MAHQRQIIRETIVAALLNRTAAGSRVFATRSMPWHRLDLPAISVYTLSETSETQSTAPRELVRTMELLIEAYVQQTGNVDEALDAISASVETAMHADPTFGQICGDSYLSATEIAYGKVEGGNRDVGLITMTYTVTYYTQAPDAADQTFNSLKAIDVKYDLANAQPTGDQAEDTLTGLDQ